MTPPELNHRELERYVQRVSDRWPVQRALLGGARVADLRGAGPQRERGPEYVDRARLRALRRRAVAGARVRLRQPVGRVRDGRAGRRPLLHARPSSSVSSSQLAVVREAAERGLELLPEPCRNAALRCVPCPSACRRHDASPSTVLLRTQSDERLVALARAGHERAFEAIVERYRRPLLRACRRILPEARAEDALQQASWPPGRLERGDEVRELRPGCTGSRTTRRSTSCGCRATTRRADGDADRGGRPRGGDRAPRGRAADADRLAALPERQREALLRTAIEGQGQEEVARELGLSSSAVRQLVHRARVTVRAAATAVVPMPMATWLAAGAGGAGTAATLAKAGTAGRARRRRGERAGVGRARPADAAAPVRGTRRGEAQAARRGGSGPDRDRDGRRATHCRDDARRAWAPRCRPRAPRRRARTAAGAARARTVPTSRPTAAPAAAPAEAATTAAVRPMAERTTAVLAAAAVRATTAATTTKAIAAGRDSRPDAGGRRGRSGYAATAAATTAGLGLATQAGRARARAPRAATTDLASQRRVQRVNTCSTAPDVLEAPCSVGTSHWL